MNLKDIKFYYDSYINYLDRCHSYFTKDYCQGMLTGISKIIRDLLLYENIEDLPNLESVTIKEKLKFKKEQGLECVNKIKIFNEYYPIYLDDYGQCYCILIHDNFINFGTYNTDIQLPAVIEVFENIFNQDLNLLIEKGDFKNE